jgi:DmsE family decaheme c-type cytochrome
MRQLIRLLGTGAVMVLVGLGSGALGAQEGQDPSEDCAVCHEELVVEFRETVHAIGARGAPSCITCHGDGTEHMDDIDDPELITMPEGVSGEGMCLTCHQPIHSMLSARSAHSDTAVFCGTCHTMHPTGREKTRLLRQDPNQMCVTCHAAQGNSFRRPFGHRLDRGGLECVSCHNPHGGAGERSLVVDRSGEVACLSCHAEKRGPFVFPHVSGVTGDCTSCHEPHGSSNPMALNRSRVDQLCLECHSPIEGGTLGSQPPAFHDLYSPRYRECTVCHVAVHGSNQSPMLLK